MDSGFFTFLGMFVAVGIALLLVILKTGGGADAGKRDLWRDVTRRLGGTLRITEGDHSIRFKWHGSNAVVVERGEMVRFRIEEGDFGGLRAELSHVPESVFREGRLRLGKGNIPAAERVDGFYVHAADLPMLREFLSPDVRRVFKDLGETCSDGEPIAEFDEKLVITGRGVAESAERLARFSVLCLQMAQHARLFAQRHSGVTLVESASADQGECQVCGALLEGIVVKCGRCSTLHHQDCWDYAGVCSTYACGGREKAG